MYDDGPSLFLIWSIFIGIGIIGLFLGALRWWASIPIFVLLGMYAVVLLSDLFAQDLFPHYMSDKPSFIPLATFGIAAGVILPLIGGAVNLIRRSASSKLAG